MKRLFIIITLLISFFSIFAQQWEMPQRFPLQGEKPGLIEVAQSANPIFFQKSENFVSLKGNYNCIDTLYCVRFNTNLYDVNDFDSAYYISGVVYHQAHQLYEPDNPTLLVRMKVDYSGNILWKQIDSMMRGDHFPMYNTSLIRTTNGYFVQMGVVINDYNSPKNWDIRIPVYIKFDSNGDTLWRRMFIDTVNMRNGDWPQDIVAEDDGGYTVAALIGSDFKTYSIDTLIDFWYVDSVYIGLIRYDSIGNTIQRKQHFLGGEKVPISFGMLMKQFDGGYIVAGENKFNGPTNPGKYYIFKTDSVFNWQWKKTFSQTVSGQSLIDIIPFDNNDYYFAVHRADTPIVYDVYGQPYYTGYYQIGIMDSSFEIISDTVFRMDLTNPPNPFYYDAGHLRGTDRGSNNNGLTVMSKVGYGANLVHLDNNLSYQWNRWLSYYPWFAEEPYKMRRAHDGGYLIVGRSKRPGTGGWFVKTDTNGFALPNGADTLYHIGIEEKNITSKDQLKVYPNPAREVVNVEMAASCQLPAASFEIVDMFGKVLIRESLERGESNFSFNVSGLPEGMYVLRVMVRDGMIRRKIVVVR